jgi:endonuclease YncB( thermonuclease family)
MRDRTRVSALAAVVLALTTGASHADEWLVYVGGGIEAIEGGWEERGSQVVFRLRGGTLVSVPYEDVDLPASTFVTWQLGGRRRVPPRPALPTARPPVEGESSPPCVGARLVGVLGGETLEVWTGEERETVHLACLDAPETVHKYPELGWFGRATKSAVETEVRRGDELCLTEQVPPQSDGEGHRIVFVTLADGRDYTAQVIAGGLGLLRPGSCDRAAHYRRLEDRAIAEERGLWGRMSARAAFAAANHMVAVGAGPPPRRRPGGS